MNQDGLYIENKWTTEFENFALTFQGNDLQKPDTLQSSYSSTIELPDTVAVRDITAGAEQPNSGSDAPYQFLPAYVVDNGNVVLRGRIALETFKRGWKGNILEAKQDVLTRLKRPLRSLNLSAYDFTWNVASINAHANATQGVCFPLVDYGTMSDREQPAETLNPALFVHTLVDEMLQQEGYRLVGSMRDDELYKRLALPFVEEKPTNATSDFVDDRRARVTTEPGQIGHKNSRNSPRNITLPLTVVNQPLEGWTQGRMMNYNPSITSYVCDVNMRVKVSAFQQFFVNIGVGTVEAKLQVERNGTVVGEEVWEKSGPAYNPLGLKMETLQLATTVDCKKGDRLRIRFILRNRTKIATYANAVYFGPDKSHAGFEPDNTLTFGDSWPVGRNLPDMACLELLRSIALLTSSSIEVDATRKQIKFISLTDVTNNVSNAVDWSDRVEESEEPELSPKLDPYSQRNYLRWKECDGIDKHYGDGLIEAKSTNTEEVTLFTLPFAATMQSTVELSGYGKPLKIETRTVSNKTVNVKSTQPRLILVEPQHPFTVNTSILNDAGNIVPATVQLMPCWFDSRPNMAYTVSNNLSLSFAPTSTNVGLIGRYFGGLKRVLRRPKVVTVSMALHPTDILALDFSRPIRIRSVRVGSMVFSDSYFYLNKIADYQSNQPCQVVLVGFM